MVNISDIEQLLIEQADEKKREGEFRYFKEQVQVYGVRCKEMDDIFDIATTLMHDDEDMVQKGYGWMLKEASKPYPIEVFDFVMLHRSSMPRTAFRYAIEKLPADLRRQAMQR